MLWTILLVTFIGVSNSLDLSMMPKNFTADDKTLSNSAIQLSKQYADEYALYLKNGVESSAMRELSKALIAHRSNLNWAHGFHGVDAAGKFVACTACKAFTTVIERMIQDPYGEWRGYDVERYARSTFLDFCARFNILAPDICSGTFDAYWPTFYYMTLNKHFNANVFCTPLKVSYCKAPLPKANWTIAINNRVQYATKPKSVKPKRGSRDIKILQITDIHFDPDYKPGALAECNEPLCCQNMPSGPVPANMTAGYWSDYHVCDAPLHMIDSAFDHMRETYKDLDYIYFTGDIIPHTSYKATRETIRDMLTTIYRLMIQKFPGIPIYPCMGNNDAHPNNMMTPEDAPEVVSSRWVYEHLFKLWSEYLPLNTRTTILRGGYYTVTPRAGFRIIALNNVECRPANLWIYYNTSYSGRQLQWLHDTLLYAENANETVHILVHIPNGGRDCWTDYANDYNRLIERFHPIIGAIFNGHTHKIDMNVFYNSQGQPINVAWNGGSITSFVGKNPNYQVHMVEPETMQVYDSESWAFNVTAANMYGASRRPEWFKLSQFAKDFTDDLSPAGLDALLDRMAADPKLLRKFWRVKMTNADPMLIKGCNQKCMFDTICGIANSVPDNNKRCNALKEKLKRSLEKESANDHHHRSAATSNYLQVSCLIGVLSLVKMQIFN